MKNYSGKLQQLLYLITSLLVVMAVSLGRDGKVLGRGLKQQQEEATKTDTMTLLNDGSIRLNTTELGKVSSPSQIQRLPNSLSRHQYSLESGMD